MEAVKFKTKELAVLRGFWLLHPFYKGKERVKESKNQTWGLKPFYNYPISHGWSHLS